MIRRCSAPPGPKSISVPEMIEQTTRVALAEHTTLRVGGPASRMIVASTEADLIEVVRDLDAGRRTAC